MFVDRRARLLLLALIAGSFVLAAPVRSEETAGEPSDLSEDCSSCHEDVATDASVHEILACTDCHSNIEKREGYPHDDAVLGAQWRAAVCASCHEAPSAEFRDSIHGRVGDDLPPELQPSCASCHGEIHAIVSASEKGSPLFPTRIAGTCAACHANPALSERGGIRIVQPIAAYEASVHGRGLQRGEKTATCTACHGSHDIRPASDAASSVSRAAVPSTCGHCHAAIAAQYAGSVHGKAASKGIAESPICTDCHGEHRILEPERPDSPVFATNVPKMTCGRCHGDLRLAEKFGLAQDNVARYDDSFHGLAARAGQTTVANCASCHGVHDILPSSDPRSHVHRDNLAQTCGTCHPGAGAAFAIGTVHTNPKEAGTVHPAVYWVRIAYLWVITLTIGAMLVHNSLDLFRKAASQIQRPAAEPRKAARVRMSLPFRLAHGVLALSFVVLAVSGFALQYPEAAWVQPLLAWEGSFALRGTVHRVAAVAMLAAFAFHFVHLLFDARARRCIASMVPLRSDFSELHEKLRWYVGARPDMPKSPTVGYTEKLEYLALLWGTAIMAVSGFALWFENWTLEHLPKWASDLATVVHFYEAVLATLAILVWHIYFVIFDPLVYPMDMAWLTGRESPGRTLEREEDDAAER